MEPFNKPDIIKRIKLLIAKDQLVEACDLFTPTFLEKEARNLKGRLQDLESRNRRGILEAREYEVSKNKIRDDLSNLVDQLDKGETIPTKRNYETLAWILGGTIFLGIASITWLSIQNESPAITKKPSIFTIDSAYHILLLPFGADGNCLLESNHYHLQVQRRINQLNKFEGLNLEVERQDTIMCDLESVESIREHGKQMGADLVVYGNYQERCEWDTTLLNIRYILIDTTINTPSIFREGEREYSVHDKESLTELRNGKLTGTIEDVMYWALGMREFNRLDYQSCIQYLEKIFTTESRQEYSDVFQLLGNSHHYLGQHNKAIINYTKAIALDSDYATTYNNRGIAHKDLKQYNLAIQDYGKAIALDAEYTTAYYNRGNTYRDLKQYDLAIQDYDKAIALDTEYRMAYINRGVAYHNLRLYNLAIQDYDKAIELNPEYKTAYYNRGIAYDDLEQYELAFQDFDKVVELDPKDATAYFNRGNAYEFRKDLKRYDLVNQGSPRQYYEIGLKHYYLAIQDFDKAIELNPDYTTAYNNRGFAYYKLGKYDLAIQDFDTVIELDPDYTTAYINRGAAYRRLKQYDLAIQDFDKAIQLDPDNVSAYNNRELAKLEEEKNSRKN